MPPVPLFWLIALLLVAATLAVLVWPLLRPRGAEPWAPDDAPATDVYRDQKRQLDAELAAGAITRDERDENLAELAARLAAELETAGRQAPAASGSPRASLIAALIVVAALPASALLLYVAIGHPGAVSVAAKSADRPPITQAQMIAMVDSLATRMKQHPEDPTGWKLLARAYSSMGRYPESVAAFERSGGAVAAGGCVGARRLGRRARDAEKLAAGRADAARGPRAGARSESAEGARAGGTGGLRAQRL